MEKRVMTLPWLNEQSRRVLAAFMTVYQHLNELR